jgi:hypothetical protein
VAARARTDLPFNCRIGQVFIVLHIFGLYGRLVGDDDPGAGGKGKPVRAAQVGRNALFQEFRLDRGEQAEFVGLGQARGIDREEDVGRAVGALVADALQQFVFLASMRLILMPVCFVKLA